MSREMDVDVVLARKKKVWEEKEEMVLAVDKKSLRQKPKPKKSSISFARLEKVIQPLSR